MPVVHMHSTSFHSLWRECHGVCHIEPFGNGHDRASFEMVFCCGHQQHGDHLQALIICQIHFGWVTMGCQRHPQIPSSAQTGTPNFNPFFSPLFIIVTFEQMTIKHSMYMQKVPFLCTERACFF